MSAGLLFSQMEPPAGNEADFHDWYNNEHIPARMRIPGFTEAIRYEQDEDAETARWLACYFLDDMAALETDVYLRLKSDPGERTARMLGEVNGFTRYICDQTSDTGASSEETGLLYVVAFSVPESDRADFDGWYDEEHVPLLMQVPGWRRVRRFAVRPGFAGPPWTHLALHELRDRDVLAAPQRAAARDTPRRDDLARRDWFKSGRWNYSPIHRATAVTTKDAV
ncbi:MAG TPA: hypothetical protein VGM33_07680 [Baekduia sp.]|jgi:hypothetical protein